MVDPVLSRIASSMREDWSGAHLVLLPQLPWKPWFPGLPLYNRVMEWSPDAQLFADSSSGERKWVPVVGEIRWAVFCLARNAYGGIFPLRPPGTTS